MKKRMNPKLKEKTLESLAAVLPISAIVMVISIFLVELDTGTAMLFVLGAIMLIVGMGMFQFGAEMAMTPLGEGIGSRLSRAKKTIVILLVTLVLGVLITVAEPDLTVLSGQVPGVPNMTLILTVAIGVGIFLAIAVARILFKFDLSLLLIGFYVVVMLLSFFVPADFLAVAFDSGGVTTGPMTVPFIMALGVGISSIRADKNATSDSFGLVAMSSVGPILAVMILGCVYKPQSSAPESDAITEAPHTMQQVFGRFADAIPHYLTEVAISLLPILAVFIVFTLLFRRRQVKQLLKSLVGFIYTYLGLVLFLCGVNVGFAPVGTLLGSGIAESSLKWLLVPIGLLIGYFIVKAEPAIQILNHQVQSVTDGAVSSKAMNAALQIGVSVSVGLAMLRILLGIPIQFIVIPGYLVALVMSRFVPKIFVGIAFDSGGVASGPMTSTFLLPLCIGACSALGGNVMTDAFGCVALVALTPLIAIQIMGISYRLKKSKLEKAAGSVRAILADADLIVELEEV